jgi:hypothetical protein
MSPKQNELSIQQILTITVPMAGKLLDLGKSASYEAAKNNQLPVMRFGGRLIVSVRSLERMLDMEPGTLAEVIAKSGADMLGHNGGPPFDEKE